VIVIRRGPLNFTEERHCRVSWVFLIWSETSETGTWQVACYHAMMDRVYRSPR